MDAGRSLPPDPELRELALANFARFTRQPGATQPDVTSSFGGILGWAALTLPSASDTWTIEEDSDNLSSEGDDALHRVVHAAALSAQAKQSRLTSARRLARVLKSTHCDISPLACALRNYETFHYLKPGEATAQDLEQTVAGVYGWAVPAFSFAKQNYETFKKRAPGSASLREVIQSSAGVFGWLAYRRCTEPGPLSTEQEAKHARQLGSLDPSSFCLDREGPGHGRASTSPRLPAA